MAGKSSYGGIRNCRKNNTLLDHVVSLSGGSYIEEGTEMFSSHFVIASDQRDLADEAVNIAINASRRHGIKEESFVSGASTEAGAAVRQNLLDSGDVLLFVRKE